MRMEVKWYAPHSFAWDVAPRSVNTSKDNKRADVRTHLRKAAVSKLEQELRAEGVHASVVVLYHVPKDEGLGASEHEHAAVEIVVLADPVGVMLQRG